MNVPFSPPDITGEASPPDAAEDADAICLRTMLPDKMKYDLDAPKNTGFFSDIVTMFRTFLCRFWESKYPQ